MLSTSPTKEGKATGMSGGNAGGTADWLGLAAAPTLEMMALLTTFTGGADMVCSATRGAYQFDGMATMYLIMGAFHLPPWLRLVSRRADGRRGGRAI